MRGVVCLRRSSIEGGMRFVPRKDIKGEVGRLSIILSVFSIKFLTLAACSVCRHQGGTKYSVSFIKTH